MRDKTGEGKHEEISTDIENISNYFFPKKVMREEALLQAAHLLTCNEIRNDDYLSKIYLRIYIYICMCIPNMKYIN